MSTILYGNLRVNIIKNIGARVQRTTMRAAPLMPRRHVSPPVRPRPLVYGRDDQVNDARQAIQARRPVGFYARCGFGVSTLLHHIATSDFAHDSGMPVALLRVGRDRTDDLLQRLVDQLYASDQRIKLTPSELVQLLGQLRAVIILDEVLLSADETNYILGVLPRCSVVTGSPQPVLDRRGTSRPVPGLSETAALGLVSGCLGRALSGAELPHARRLIAEVHGQPLHLKQAAALVRFDQYTFEELAESAGRDPAMLDRLCISRIPPAERTILALLTMAAGALIPADLITVMTDIADVTRRLRRLSHRGLAEQCDDRFGLPICNAPRYRDILLEDLQVGSSARLLATWLTARDPAGPDSVSALEAALRLLEFAAERRDWTTVISLIRAVDPILALAGRWEAWRHVLDMGINAAHLIGDTASEALFCHEQGTRALCQDELDSAQQHLQQALQLREQAGDRAGVSITTVNLRLLWPEPAQPIPSRPPRSHRTAITVAGILAAVLASAAVGLARHQPPAAHAASNSSSPSPPSGGTPSGGTPSGGTPNGGTKGTPLPDLVPTYSKPKNASILVVVKNIGNGTAPPSTTTIDFGSLGLASPSETPEISAGDSQIISFDAPSACLMSGCTYTVTVNSDNRVNESHADNNQATFNIISTSPPPDSASPPSDSASPPSDCAAASPDQAPSPAPSCTGPS